MKFNKKVNQRFSCFPRIARKKAVMSITQILLLIGMSFAVSYMIYSADNVSAVGTISSPSVCCEKTNSGAWCINTNEASCNSQFKTAPTSCDTTSYCKLGTCYDSGEGICMENTPQRVCDGAGGAWDPREIEEVPQCQLGCCVIADQAALVPLVRCKRLSSLFGVENDYRTDITDEVECIATAQSQDIGACVYEQEFERICEFTTRKQCGAGNVVEAANGTNVTLTSEKRFYENYLCSAEELNTVCARQMTTNCYQGNVYWFDSCGNRENVYSSDKDLSWNGGKYVEDADEICNRNDGRDKNCGNCDYLLGSRCAEWEGVLGIGKPTDSDYYCRNAACTDRDGNKRKNGESWCVYDTNLVGGGSDPVGSRYYREICSDGEVVVEPCADYRNEVCFEQSVEISSGKDYNFAACRVNRWQECVAQTNEDDCLNIDKRDCTWLPSVTGMVLGGGNDGSSSFSNPTTSSGAAFTNPTATGAATAPITGNALFGGSDSSTKTAEPKTTTNRPSGICAPDFSPGLEFWEDGEARGICAQASAQCVVKFEKGLIGSEKCVENCECLEDGWALKANSICTALGDCGGYINYIGKYTGDGYDWKVDGEDKEFSSGVSTGGGGVSGKVINDLIPLVSGTAGTPGSEVKQTGGVTSNSAGAGALLPVGLGWPNSGGYGTRDVPIPAGDGLKITGIVKATAAPKWIETALKSPINFENSVGETINAKSVFYNPDTKVFALTKDGKLPVSEEILKAGGADASALAKSAVASQTPAFAGGQATLAEMLKLPVGGGMSALVSGLQWAGIAAVVGQLAGGLFGLNKDNTNALSAALGGGAFVYESLMTYNFNAPGAMAGGLKFLGPQGFLGASTPLVMGVAVAAIIFVLMYKDESTQIVTFNCLPWQAPTGGNDCEKCNDATLQCSQYRCKSLGQNCEVVNEGTENEKCVNVNPRDVTPPIITPSNDKLTAGYKYTDVKNSPPGPGFKIVKDGKEGGCIDAYTPIKFSLNTDEPAQCKIDYEHTTEFDEMGYWVGSTNLYLYNHTEQLSLPGPSNLEGQNLTIDNDGEWNLFVRCQDKNGNKNEAEYAVRFCVDKAPDNTAPQVRATSINNGGCVASDTDSANVEFYTNEPTECRWSPIDQDYDSMDNSMTCTNQIYQINALQLYTCKTTLKGIARDETTFYVRCKDQPGKEENDRNENKQSYEFSLRGSTDLKIKNLQPNGTIFGAVNPAPVELYIESLFGCDAGKAICYYSDSGKDNDYIMFYDTNTNDGIHTQRLDLTAGSKKYWFKCVDSGGNSAVETTTFNLDIDTTAPTVARVYEEDKMLKVVTVRNSECAYSFDDCDFLFEEGTEMPYAGTKNHVVEWNEDKTYYIKCRDEFKNEEADCSVVVRPTKNFL